MWRFFAFSVCEGVLLFSSEKSSFGHRVQNKAAQANAVVEKVVKLLRDLEVTLDSEADSDEKVQMSFLEGFKNFFLKILVMRANFGDFGILVSTSKFWKKFVTRVRPYWDKFWKILTIEFWWNRKVMINHRGGILIFGQILSKFQILDFRVKDLKFCDFVKFWILGLRISNFRFSSKFSSNLFNFDQNWNFVV